MKVNRELMKIDKENIKELIHTLRGIQIIIDYDLANLYAVKTKGLNEQVKRNKERFPEVLCFN